MANNSMKGAAPKQSGLLLLQPHLTEAQKGFEQCCFIGITKLGQAMLTQWFWSFLSGLRNAPCNQSPDYSIGNVESHMG